MKTVLAPMLQSKATDILRKFDSNSTEVGSI